MKRTYKEAATNEYAQCAKYVEAFGGLVRSQ
jgi:hypothetical protein